MAKLKLKCQLSLIFLNLKMKIEDLNWVKKCGAYSPSIFERLKVKKN